MFTAFDPNYPQVKVDLDREKARTLGVPVNDVFQALSATLGGAYVNDFNRFGRLYRVYAQADAESRLKAEDIGKVHVRSKTTDVMVPLSTLVTIPDVTGSELTTRFNLQRSVEIQGAPARGYTSGQALAALEQVFAETMPGDGFRLLVDVVPGEGGASLRRRPSSWPSSACSCCWPRSTRAGGCPGRSSSGRRWWRSARSSASG